MDDFYIMKKKIDKSVLFQGLTIPVIFQEIFYSKTGRKLKHGESYIIKGQLCGVSYGIKVVNLGFNKNKYANHTDILQLRYDSNKMLIEALRANFPSTWNKMKDYYAENKTYSGFRVQNNEEEYLAIYAANGTLFFECLPANEYITSAYEIKKMDEYQFEVAEDNNAYIESKIGLKKIRHLSKSIGNSLKEIYSFRCQICGKLIGEEYGTHLVHAHHIDYFTKSLNNNPENIIIVCPNHHGIIHNCNPLFNRREKQFEYPNGYKEGLLLNLHI